jgi:two-component system, NarL family, sensor histidine kinase DesK
VADRSASGDRRAAGGATGAVGPTGFGSAADDRSRAASRFFRSAWLVFVAYPIVVLINDRPDPIEVVLVVTGVGLFVGLLALASRTPDSRSRASWIGPAIVLLLLAVATVLVLRDPDSGFYPFYFYASTGASALLPPQRALGLMVVSGILAGLVIWTVSQDLATAIVQGVSVTIIGVVIFSTAQVRRTNRQLVQARHELARLAVADERTRIARDLHDTLGQTLSVITLKSELAGRLLPDQPERARSEIRDIERVAREAMASVRATVGGYRRPTLEAELAAARETLTAADIAPSIESVHESLPPVVDAVLAWTVREGVTNIVRHSNALHVRIRIDRQADWAEATITDDGSGTGHRHDAGIGDGDEGAAAAGSGLIGLSERVTALGGRFEAGPVPGGGFRLDVALPIEAATP